LPCRMIRAACRSTADGVNIQGAMRVFQILDPGKIMVLLAANGLDKIDVYKYRCQNRQKTQ